MPEISAESTPWEWSDYIFDGARQISEGRTHVSHRPDDSMGRLTHRVYPTRSETFTYDASGQRVLTRWGSDTNHERYSFDSAGRVVAHFQAWVNDTCVYTYDTDGRMASLVGPFGATETYTRDAQGRLSSLSSFAGNFAWTFDAAGRPTTMTRPNGISTSFSYENIGRISRIRHDSNVTALLDILYSYDSGGQIVTQTEDTNTITYGDQASHHLSQLSRPLALWTTTMRKSASRPKLCHHQLHLQHR